jgi:hypothetical protein
MVRFSLVEVSDEYKIQKGKKEGEILMPTARFDRYLVMNL